MLKPLLTWILLALFLLAPAAPQARYYNAQTGRFWTMDDFEGHHADPLSLHKYLYAHGNPVNNVDPSGNAVEGGINGQAFTVNAVGQMATRGGMAIGRSAGWAVRRINYAALRGLQFYAANEGWITLGTFLVPPAVMAGLDLLANNEAPVPRGNFPRGRMAENTFGANLGGNFPVIDHWDPEGRHAVSVRSHSLANPANWQNSVLADITEVRDGVKQRLEGNSAGSGTKVNIPAGQIQTIYLVEVVTETEIAAQNATGALANIRNQAGNVRVILAPMKNWRR